MNAPPFELVVLEGLTSYEKAHALQLETVERRRAGEVGDTLIILEHEPVITLGKNADEAGVTATPGLLAQRGIQVHRVERGGQATYHGPGQIVGYPILNLHELRFGVSEYIRRLEEMMICAAASLGVRAYRKNNMTGVFCEKGKIGAIGVRVSRDITFHGFAFNLSPRLGDYQLIIPCGMVDTPVSSIEQVTGEDCSIESARTMLVEAFEEVVFEATRCEK
jgi:lipoyl(octanoyl) transferase